MIKNVCEFEGYNYNDEVIKFISEECKGIPRDALVWLNGVANEGTWTKESAKEVAGLAFGEDDPQIIELNRAILKGSFKTATNHFDKVKKVYPPETIRVAVTGYIAGCLKRAKTAGEARKFSAILDFFTIPIYETGKPGEHKLFNYIFKATDCVNDPGFYTK
jgi:DNA polymerase III gamma/tau subunit